MKTPAGILRDHPVNVVVLQEKSVTDDAGSTVSISMVTDGLTEMWLPTTMLVP